LSAQTISYNPEVVQACIQELSALRANGAARQAGIRALTDLLPKESQGDVAQRARSYKDELFNLSEAFNRLMDQTMGFLGSADAYITAADESLAGSLLQIANSSSQN